MSDDPKTIVNIDYLGRCYDVVEMDPLNLGSSAKLENAINIDDGDTQTSNTHHGTWAIPKGVHHVAPFTMRLEQMTSVISSSYDFQEDFKRSIKVDAGVEGVFEFSGSESVKEIAQKTESRKDSFAYSRLFQENHILGLDLDNPKASLVVTNEFLEAVEQLPVGDSEDVIPAYEAFIGRFGTHFTKEITLGGLAFQRTSGSSRTYLESREKEQTLAASASIQLKQLSAGASAEQAHSEAAKVDREQSLRRSVLEFRGGTGSPDGIDASWIQSLHEYPGVVAAKLEPLSALLTMRFFPKENFIVEKQHCLELAAQGWIATKGKPGCCAAPLRFGEPLMFTIPTPLGFPGHPEYRGAIRSATVWDWSNVKYFGFPLRGKDLLPWVNPEENAAVHLESVDGHRANAVILAGEQVRIRLIASQSYVGKKGGLVNSVAAAGSFTVLLFGDSPAAPSRLGEYLLETDEVMFLTGQPGAPEETLDTSEMNGSIYVGNAGYPDRARNFCLKRCDAPET